MTDFRFTDAATISGARRTQDGYLVAEAFAVRTGIQMYAASELGLVGDEAIPVWRPEDEVRSPASLATFSHAPITLGHPADNVTDANWKDLAKGEVSTEATWDGNKIKLPLIVKDAEAIAAIEAGTRELSAGYMCALEFADGVTPEGEAYRAIQRNIRINHLAVVPKGRAGSECRIGDTDARWGAFPITIDRKDERMTGNVSTRTVLIDGLSVETTDAGAQALEKLQGVIADKEKAITDAKAAHDAAIAAKDEEIGALKADLKKAKDAEMTPERLSAMVADRVALESTIKAIDAGIKTAGVSDADLRKAAVAKKLGDDMVDGASDAEISGMFKAVAKDVKPKDPVASALASGTPTTDADLTDADKAYAENIAHLNTAYKYADANVAKEA